MPKNKTGGKKGKRGGNKNQGNTRELVFKEDGQEYGRVIKMLGNCRINVLCFDGKERLGIICGQMRKRVFINQDDIVLVCLRDYQDAKCDVVMKYTTDEARTLQAYGEIPKEQKIEPDNTMESTTEDFPFEFGEPDNDEDENLEVEAGGVDLDEI